MRQVTRPTAQQVEADVGRDPVEPGTEHRAAIEAVATAPGAQECLLHRVLGLVERGEHPIAMDVQLATVALGEVRERRLVGDCGRLDRRGHGAWYLTSWTSQPLPSGSLTDRYEP